MIQVYRCKAPPLDIPSTSARSPPTMDPDGDSSYCISFGNNAKDEFPLYVLMAQ